MKTDWKKVKLQDICESISDGDHLPPPKAEKGIPFVTIANIKNNQFDFTNTMFVPELYYEKLDNKRKAKIGDILYSVVGSFGIPVLIKNNEKIVFQRHIAILRPEKIDSHFLFYTMLSKAFYAKANAVAIGAAQRTVSLTALRNIEIYLPPLETQKKIAHILSRYDEAIENNNKRIKLLEQMAQNLYKEWFVRFRFPGYENCEFENGIPVGWNVEKLGNVANISTGKCNREDAEDDGIYPLFDRSQEIKLSNDWIKDCEAIIVPGEGTSFIPRYFVGKFNLHQRCYCVEPKTDKTGKFLFYTLMLNRKYFLSVATGATVPSLRYNNFAKMKFVMPELGVCQKFDDYITKYFLQIDNLKIANKNLAKQRDLLLPRLMSGKIEVN